MSDQKVVFRRIITGFEKNCVMVTRDGNKDFVKTAICPIRSKLNSDGSISYVWGCNYGQACRDGKCRYANKNGGKRP